MSDACGLDEFYGAVKAIRAAKPKTKNIQEHFFKLNEVVGEGFIFWKDKGYVRRGKHNKRVRIADFICPVCKEVSTIDVKYVMNTRIKDCGCTKK